MINLDNKNKNLLVENIIVFFLFTVFLVFKSLKTLSKIFTYGIVKKEILTTKSNLGVDIKIKLSNEYIFSFSNFRGYFFGLQKK